MRGLRRAGAGRAAGPLLLACFLASPFAQLGVPGVARAQELPAAPDSLTLGRLYAAAMRNDARASQALLNETALGLRIRNLRAEWLPALTVRGEARYQSDVPNFRPAGAPDAPDAPDAFPTVPKDSYEAVLGVRQTIFDAGRTAGRGAVERATTAEQQADLASTLYALRLDVDRAYFGALALDARIEETRLLIEDLAQRLRETEARVGAGVALSGEAAAIEAELLRAEQRVEELRADRRAALAVLSSLTGLALGEAPGLAVPDLSAAVAAARERPEARRHPAFAQFEAAGERLARQADLAGRARLPTLAAFGEAGYARPGLNIFGDSWDTYWLGGVRVEWAPWQWGSIGREQELLGLRREAVELEANAFAADLGRATAEQIEDLGRLEATLPTDARVVELRERVTRQAERRFGEGVVTAAVYVDARTDLLEARIARRLHAIELAETRARYLTALGVEIP